MAAFAERILCIEEEKLHDQPRMTPSPASVPIDSSLPAASERIHALEIVMHDSAGRFDARVTRYSCDSITRRRTKSVLDYPI